MEWLIVGLGNPGRKYEHTRHNIGFMVVESLARRLKGAGWRNERHARVLRAELDGDALLIAQPQTFMNDSGLAVRELAGYYRVPPSNIVVVNDDLDLPFGRLRLRPRGTAGGHNGLRSIIAELGTQEFPRLKIGIGRPVRGEPIDWVLAPFEADERQELDIIIVTATDVLLQVVREGLIPAMNACNGQSEARRPDPGDATGAARPDARTVEALSAGDRHD